MATLASILNFRLFLSGIAFVLALSGWCHVARCEDSLAALAQKLDAPDRASVLQAYSQLKALARIGGNANAQDILRDYHERCLAFITLCGSKRPVGPARLPFPSMLQFTTRERIPLTEMRKVYAAEQLGALLANSPDFSDEHLAYFAGKPTLTFIDLEATKVTGATLHKLETDKLAILRLAENPLTEKFLLDVEFPQLEALDVRKTNMSNLLLEKLRAPALMSLYIGDTQIDKSGLVHLSRFKELTFIRLDLAQLSRETLAAIVGLNPNLAFVEVRCTKEEFSQVAALKPAVGLKCKLAIYVTDVPTDNRAEFQKRLDDTVVSEP